MKDMSAKSFAELLRRKDVCIDAREWSEGKTLAEAWAECPRGDWMLWLVSRMADEEDWPSRKEVVLGACACARKALKYVNKGEKRPLIAIQIAEKWARGKASIEDVKRAANAAFAAYTTASNASAAYATSFAAIANADANAADTFASFAVIAAGAAYDADAADVRAKSLAVSANICRKLFVVQP